jgi:hypothetical protein
VAGHHSNTIIKFADDKRVVGLITDDDKTAYREIRNLAVCCQNNLFLNVSNTKELIVDYRKWRAEHSLIHIERAEVEQIESFKFFGVHIPKDLLWSKHTNSREEGLTTHFPPQEAKKIWHGPSDHQKVI